jgi:5-methylcytosine-specific restriction protein A
MTTTPLVFQPGAILTRKQIHPVLGGSGFAGICPAIEKCNVLLFSDSKVGERYGYHDGWLAEDDDLGPVFTYTGAGKRGNQTFTGGNLSILEHARMGRTLHLFVAVGKVPGSDTRTHRYIGMFKLDERRPFDIREAKDELGQNRDVIVFRLRPIGRYVREAADTLQVAPRSRLGFSRTAGRYARATRRRSRERRPQTGVDQVTATRDDLADAFEERETASGETIGQLDLAMRNSSSRLMFELYNPTNNTVYEPTGSAASESITQALAQLLLARRYLNEIPHDQPLHLMVLAPALPQADLRDLLTEHGIGLVYRNDSGGFSEFTEGTFTRSFRCVDCPVPA